MEYSTFQALETLLIKRLKYSPKPWSFCFSSLSQRNRTVIGFLCFCTQLLPDFVFSQLLSLPSFQSIRGRNDVKRPDSVVFSLWWEHWTTDAVWALHRGLQDGIARCLVCGASQAGTTLLASHGTYSFGGGDRCLNMLLQCGMTSSCIRGISRNGRTCRGDTKWSVTIFPFLPTGF